MSKCAVYQYVRKSINILEISGKIHTFAPPNDKENGHALDRRPVSLPWSAVGVGAPV